MPGIELSRIINIGDNEEDLLCGICHSVFVNPMVTQCCQQTYCNECVKKWLDTNKCPNEAKCSAIVTRRSVKKLTPPPRVIINLLNKLKLRCDFVEEGCMEEVDYGRYKQHVRDCQYNPKLICIECGVKNGKRAEHNCVDNLVLRHKCLQVLQTRNQVLVNSNKNLSGEKLNLDKQLSDLKKKYDEKNIELLALSDSMTKKNRRLEVNNKELSEKCKRFELEVLNLKTSLNEMNTSLNETLNRRNDLNEKNNNLDANNDNITDDFNVECVNISKSNQTLNDLKKETNECDESNPSKLVKINKRLSEQCNGYISEITDLKNKSFDTITELNETIKRKNEQIEKYAPLNEMNKRLEERNRGLEDYNRILKGNIGNLCLIKQTDLEKTSLELKVNDINILRRQVIDGGMIRIRDLWWNLRAKFIVDDNVEYLSFYLVCNGNRMESSIKWSCIASFEMSIKPLRKVLIADNNVLKRSRVYTKNDNCFGFDKFMPWLMVIDEKNGYVKDNSILLKVCLSFWN